MQSYKDDELVDTRLDLLENLLDQAKSIEANKRIIAELPTKGSRVFINGLSFIVSVCNSKEGLLVLKIEKPQKKEEP